MEHEILERESVAMENARRRLSWVRWYWFVGIMVVYASWDAFDTLVLNRFDPILGGVVIDWGSIALLGVLLTFAISRWEDRQFARIGALAARNAAAERTAIQLEAAQVTARAVAHNLNQPLAAIRGYAELLRDTPTCERSTEDLLRVIEEADRAAAMVRQLLQITHYETIPYLGDTPMFDLSRATSDER